MCKKKEKAKYVPTVAENDDLEQGTPTHWHGDLISEFLKSKASFSFYIYIYMFYNFVRVDKFLFIESGWIEKGTTNE